MSLRDEHLVKALEHAPDRDIAPSEVARKNILNYANKIAKQASQKPHSYWLAGLFSGIKNWQWAGAGSLAVALLIVLMVRHQFPEDTVWEASVPKEMAESQAEVATDKSTEPKATFKTEGRVEIAAAPEVAAKAPARAEQQAKIAQVAPAEALPPNATTEIEPAVTAIEKSDEHVAVADSAEAKESAPAVAAPASLPSVESAARARPLTKPATAAKNASQELNPEGVAKAKQDIAEGVLRILVADWPVGKPLFDEATGYRVEIIHDLTPEALEAYNQTMRDWFNARQ